jgi:hypothetical protein
LRRVYEVLDLPGFATVQGAFGAYLTAQRAYRKNNFTLTDAEIALVSRHWRFALEDWAYTPADVSI